MSDKKWFVRLKENIKSIFIAIVIALLIRTFVIQAFKIPSGSMLETLQIGDFIIVNKFWYGVRNPFTNKVLIPISTPNRGEIIDFEYPKDPDKDFIKRVVAIEGDTVEIIDGVLYVNDEAKIEDFIKKEQNKKLLGMFSLEHNDDNNVFFKDVDNYPKRTIPKDSYFVLGDNRGSSLDSRFWGFVHKDRLRGKALIIYWSWDKVRKEVRWKRIGNAIK